MPIILSVCSVRPYSFLVTLGFIVWKTHAWNGVNAIYFFFSTGLSGPFLAVPVFSSPIACDVSESDYCHIKGLANKNPSQMFITLADTFNNAFLWVECDFWGERQELVTIPFPSSPPLPMPSSWQHPDDCKAGLERVKGIKYHLLVSLHLQL